MLCDWTKVSHTCINQVTLLQNKCGLDNLHQLINIIAALRDSTGHLAVSSLDAKMALVPGHAVHLFHILAKFGLGKQFIALVKLFTL